MPRITVQMFEGRTVEQKRQLIAGVTDVVVRTCGADPDHVTVVIDEMKRENYGHAGKMIYVPEES